MKALFENKKTTGIRLSLILISIMLILSASGCSTISNSDSPFGSFLSAFFPTATVQEILATNSIISTSESSDALKIQENSPIEEVAEEIIEPTPTIHTLQVWVPPQFDTEQDTSGGKALSEAITSYMELHPNINITLRVKATSGDSSAINTLTAANHIAKDVLPSLALLTRSDMEIAYQRGLLQPFTTSILSDTSSWYSYARQSAVIDSSIYGIPVLGDGLVLTYRPSKLGAELTDWQDILTRGMPIGFAPASSTSLFGTFIYLSMGGKLTNDQGQPYLDQQKLTDTLNFFLSGGQNGAFPPSLAQLVDQAQVWQRFNDGTMNIIVSQFSAFRHYQTPEISVHELPPNGSSSEYPLVSTWNLVLIEDNPDLQQEAISFAEYLSDISVNDNLSAGAGYLPVRVSDHEAWQDDPQYDVVDQIAVNATLVPNNTVINKLVPIINNSVAQVIRNQMTPEAAAQDAISTLN